MNILFANEYFVPFAPGGAEWSMYHWIRILSGRGHRVAVVTPDLSAGKNSFFNEDEPLTKEGGVEIHRFPFRKQLPMPPRVFPSYIFGNPIFTKYFAGQIIKIAKSFNPDLFFAQGFDAISAVAEAGQRAKIPTVCTIRDYRALCPISICLHHRDYAPAHCTYGDFQKCLKDYYSDYGFPTGLWKKSKAAGRRFLEWQNSHRMRAYLKQLSGAVFVSNGIRNIYQRSRLCPELSEVVYNPLPDSDDFGEALDVSKRYDLPAGRYLLFVGRFSIGKGAQVLDKALPMIRKEIPDAIVVVAGNREYETENTGFKFLGHVDQNAMASLYRNCLAVVLPSRWQEPFSRVLLESCRFGAPIIATESGGNAEGVKDGKNGIVVPRNDPEEFARSCIQMLKMKSEQREQMGKEGMILAETCFANEPLAENMESFLNQVISGSKQ